MRRRLSPEERRAELIAFGRRFFAEHPADAFTMDEIAARAGVSKGLLYNYFGGRRGFYVATVEAIAAQVADVTAPEGGMSFDAALRRALGRYRIAPWPGAITMFRPPMQVAYDLGDGRLDGVEHRG